MGLINVNGSVGASFPQIQMPEDGDTADASDFLASTIQKLADWGARLRSGVPGRSSGTTKHHFGVGCAYQDNASSMWIRGVTNHPCPYIETTGDVANSPQVLVLDIASMIPPVGAIHSFGLWVCGGAQSGLPPNQFQAQLIHVASPDGVADPDSATATVVYTLTQAEASDTELNKVQEISTTLGGTPHTILDRQYRIEVLPPRGSGASDGSAVLGGWLMFTDA